MTGFGIDADQRAFHLGLLRLVRLFGVSHPGEVLQLIDPEQGGADVEDRVHLLEKIIPGLGVLLAPGEADSLDVEAQG